MRHDDPEMLAALRQALEDLEKMKVISSDNRETVCALKASLRQRIANIEDTRTQSK